MANAVALFIMLSIITIIAIIAQRNDNKKAQKFKDDHDKLFKEWYNEDSGTGFSFRCEYMKSDREELYQAFVAGRESKNA